MKRVIFHIDVYSAFLSWEAVYRLYHLGAKQDLRTMVSAVGGDMAMRHGIILAKSIPSKKFNIKTGESIMEARQKCPHLYLVPPNYGLYERCSKAFVDILHEYSPAVDSIRKRYGIDSVKRACFVKSPIDHLSGGVSREKRSVDYSKLQTEQGEIIPVENIQVLTSEKQYYAGIMTWKYKCKAVSNEREQEFILLFTPETCLWKMIL